MGLISIAGALATAGARARAGHLAGEREGEAEIRRRALQDLDRAAGEETRTIARRQADEASAARQQQARFRETQLATERTRAEAAATQARAAVTRANRPTAARSARSGAGSSSVQEAMADRQNRSAWARVVAAGVRDRTKADQLTGLPTTPRAQAMRESMDEADLTVGPYGPRSRYPEPAAAGSAAGSAQPPAAATPAPVRSLSPAAMQAMEAELADAAELFQQVQAHPRAREEYEAAVEKIMRRHGALP